MGGGCWWLLVVIKSPPMAPFCFRVHFHSCSCVITHPVITPNTHGPSLARQGAQELASTRVKIPCASQGLREAAGLEGIPHHSKAPPPPWLAVEQCLSPGCPGPALALVCLSSSNSLSFAVVLILGVCPSAPPSPLCWEPCTGSTGLQPKWCWAWLGSGSRAV